MCVIRCTMSGLVDLCYALGWTMFQACGLRGVLGLCVTQPGRLECDTNELD